MIYARERDDVVMRGDVARKVDKVAAILAFDLEARELAQLMVRMRRHVVSVKEDGVYFGSCRSEMASRAFDLDPIAFTNACRNQHGRLFLPLSSI